MPAEQRFLALAKKIGGRPVGRPTALPAPSEHERDDPAIVAFLVQLGRPASRAEIAAGTGSSRTARSWSRLFVRLERQGAVTATGATNARLYAARGENL